MESGKVKVLPLDFYVPLESDSPVADMLNEGYRQELRDYHKEVPVVFNRMGRYLTKDKCWFEVEGKAYKYCRKQFLWELEGKHVREMDSRFLLKLKELASLDYSLLTKRQRDWLAHYNHNLELRKIRLNFLKYRK